MISYKQSVILLSGGLDSCVLCAVAMREEAVRPAQALTIDYGQRNRRELEAAARIANFYDIPQTVLAIPSFGMLIQSASGLLNPNEKLTSSQLSMGQVSRAYVPARNIVLMSIALSFAEAKALDLIWVGFTGDAGAPDTTPLFLQAFNDMSVIGTVSGLNQHRPIIAEAPLIKQTKAGIIRTGLEFNAPLAYSWSCYQGDTRPCGVCNACKERFLAFKSIGQVDPLGDYEVIPA